MWIVLLVTAASSLAAGTAIGLNWPKSEVIPVVLVKPGIGGFVPTEGSSIGNTWSKEAVKPVLLVKPGIGGFEPVEGLSIGNHWSKDEVIPVSLTEPGINGFSAIDFSDAADTGSRSVTPSASIIESQIDGDFNGWEGETIIRLTNGQIWQQSSYHYEYHYAFMPKVLIYKSGGAYKAKVDGTETSVSVTRLK
jgi:hypothetical protein